MAAVLQHERSMVTTNEYAEQAATAAESLRGDAGLVGVELVIEQRITDEGGEIARYHLLIGDGAVEVVDGAASSPDVVITQDRATADSIRHGEAHAHRAFLTGRLRVDGDIDRLLEHGDVLAGLVGNPTDSDA